MRKYGVQFSGHGSSFLPEHPVCDKTLQEAQIEALEWELIADTIGGLAHVVGPADDGIAVYWPAEDARKKMLHPKYKIH